MTYFTLQNLLGPSRGQPPSPRSAASTPSVSGPTPPDQIPAPPTINRGLLDNLRAKGGSAFNALKTILQEIKDSPPSEKKILALGPLALSLGMTLGVDILASSLLERPFVETLAIKTDLPFFLRATLFSSVPSYVGAVLVYVAIKGQARRAREAAEEQAREAREAAEKTILLKNDNEMVSNKTTDRMDRKYDAAIAEINRNHDAAIAEINRNLIKKLAEITYYQRPRQI